MVTVGFGFVNHKISPEEVESFLQRLSPQPHVSRDSSAPFHLRHEVLRGCTSVTSSSPSNVFKARPEETSLDPLRHNTVQPAMSDATGRGARILARWGGAGGPEGNVSRRRCQQRQSNTTPRVPKALLHGPKGRGLMPEVTD